MLRDKRLLRTVALIALWSLLMAVGFLTEQLGSGCQVRVRFAWGANINANSSTWTWTDVTSDVQQENGKYINISPIGKPPESTQTPPATVQFTLDNRQNLYSKNNPLCINWPNVRQYTPVWIEVTLDSGSHWWTMFKGEVSTWQPTWDTTGNYAVVVVTAKGRMQRQNQHKNPLRSAMERYISTASPTPVGYWPLEDGPNTLQAQSPIPGVSSAVRQYDDGFALPLPAWGTFTNTAPGSDAGANFQNGAAVIAPVIGGTAGTTGWTVAFAFNVGATFQSSDTLTFLSIITGADSWGVLLDLTNFKYQLSYVFKTATGSTGLIPSNPTWANTFTPFDDAMHLAVVTAVQSGANINWTFTLYKDDNTFFTFSGSVASHTLQPVTNVSMGNDNTSTSFAWTMQHVGVWNGFNTVSGGTLSFKLYGDRGRETPRARMIRLCFEEGIEFTGDGFYDSSVLMGPQPSKSLMDNLRLCEVSDDGFMYDGLTAGINYQGVSQRNDQNTAITLAITDLAQTFDPLDNDLNAVNQVRVDRDGGSFYISERTTGILGSGADGMGVVDGSVTISNSSDDLLPHRAGWETWKGTVAGFRYPLIYLNFAARPSLATKWINRSDGGTGPITPGAKMVITSPASYATQHPVENVELNIVGWAMRISRFKWEVDVMCENNHQYDVHKINDSALGRLETSSSTVSAAVSSGASTLYVSSAEDNLWSTSAGDYSADAYVDGIRCAVSAVASAASDTFTRSVSNGWGTPDVSPSSNAWNIINGVAGDFSATGTRGRHSQSDTNNLRYSTLDIGSADFDYYVDCIIPGVASATGANLTQWIIGRMTDVNNYYFAQLSINTSGGVSIQIGKRASGVSTLIGSFVQVTTSGHAAGDVWTVRFLGRGTTLKVKAWVPASNGENAWKDSITDSSLTTGTLIALGSRRETGNTNTSPVLSEFDNLIVQNPQKFTISGLTKNVPVGRVVNLWQSGVLRY